MISKSTEGIDQYGDVYRNLGKHPRKALMDRLHRKSAQRMYVDRKDGTSKHVGYIIAGRWIALYVVIPWNKLT